MSLPVIPLHHRALIERAVELAAQLENTDVDSLAEVELQAFLNINQPDPVERRIARQFSLVYSENELKDLFVKTINAYKPLGDSP